MTVKELIEILSTMPPDATVIYRQFGDIVTMIAEQIEEVKPADEWIERNGTYMKYKPELWNRDRNGKPKFISSFSLDTKEPHHA